MRQHIINIHHMALSFLAKDEPSLQDETIQVKMKAVGK